MRRGALSPSLRLHWPPVTGHSSLATRHFRVRRRCRAPSWVQHSPPGRGSTCYEKLRFGLPAMPGWLFVRRGSLDPAVRPTAGLHVTRRRSGTGRPAVAEDGGSGDHCPNQLPHELQSPILYFRTLSSATGSSRGVREPGTGAEVVQDQLFTGTGRTCGRENRSSARKGRVAPGDCSPGAPTDPYVPFQAYGSSYHELATGRLPE